MKYLLLSISLLLLLAGCDTTQNIPVLPTLAEPDAIATGFVLTENAPPAGFDTVSFPTIDANLPQLAGWRYEMFFAFEGVFARTPRTVSASTQAIISYNQVGSARRVEALLDNDLEGLADPLSFEGVRLGPDAFLVRDGRCAVNTPDAELLADLSAGSLLGGVDLATSVARSERINGQEVWLYNFLADDLLLPNVQIGEDGRLLSLVGELWVAPEHNVVVRYNATLEVENATILDQSLPISGTINLQYNLFDIGDVPNINVPNGC
ncbi:MAG: hypothetical protein ACFE0Q_16815 [Anaerolineae bacterium]